MYLVPLMFRRRLPA